MVQEKLDEREEERKAAAAEKQALKNELINEYKSIISGLAGHHIASPQAGGAKKLKSAASSAKEVSAIQAEQCESLAEAAATSLMDKFSKMGSKVLGGNP